MKALLIISHGSRRDASNQEVMQLSLKIREQLESSFDIVESAFLELATPLIPDGVSCCVSQGATEILVIPYFLAAGRHVAEDIPEIIESVRPAYPDVKISIAPHLGGSELMASFVANSALRYN